MTKATKRLSKGKRSSWINSWGNWCLRSLLSSTSYLILWEQRSWFLNYHSEPRVYTDASLPAESSPDFSYWYTNSFIMYVYAILFHHTFQITFSMVCLLHSHSPDVFIEITPSSSLLSQIYTVFNTPIQTHSFLAELFLITLPFIIFCSLT